MSRSLLFLIISFLLPIDIYSNKIWEVHIHTVDGVLPEYEVATPPIGCFGEGIKNATKVPGSLKIVQDNNVIYDSGEYSEKESGITLKIRGNTSATRSPKKPYKIKLQKKADLLCRGDIHADKDWLLIKSVGLNGFVGLKVNELVGMTWTPSFKYVSLFLNDEFKGVYMLCESVKRNPQCRVNVDKSGYLFEYDAYWWNEDYYVQSNYELPMHYTFKYPESEDISEIMLCNFKNIIDKFEESVKDGSYNNYIEIETFVRWAIAHDILGTIDAVGSNIFCANMMKNPK